MPEPDYNKQVREALPELTRIQDEELRARVHTAWVDALNASGYNDVRDVPWWPPNQDVVGEQQHVKHVRDVTMIASRLADTLADCRDLDLDRDLILAGALTHDISKPLELSPDGVTEFGQLVPHPYAAIHILASAGLSAEIQHIALSHSPQTAVSPQNLEAHVVALADEAAIHALSVDATGSIQADLF